MGATLRARVRRLLGGDEAGQDLIEYALLVALIVLVAVTALTEVGATIRDVFWAVIAASIPQAAA
jgi:Flp pilus assembly pilin Flp